MTAGEAAKILEGRTRDYSPDQIRAALAILKAKTDRTGKTAVDYFGMPSNVGGTESFSSRFIDGITSEMRENPKAIREYLVANGMNPDITDEAMKILRSPTQRGLANRVIVQSALEGAGSRADGRAVEAVMGSIGKLRRGVGRAVSRKGLAAALGLAGDAVLGANPLDMFLEAQPLGNGDFIGSSYDKQRVAGFDVPGYVPPSPTDSERIADIVGPRPLLDKDGNPIPTLNMNPYAR